MLENREVIVLWTHLQISKLDSEQGQPEEQIQQMLDRVNSYITNEEDKGELVRHFGGYAIIGTKVTKKNWDSFVLELKDLNE